MSCIRGHSIINTRRSAGIPSLITGIVSANPDGVLSLQIISELFKEARGQADYQKSTGDAKLPQVHAMNCLKEIFTDKKLGPSSELYVTQGLDLAVGSLASNM